MKRWKSSFSFIPKRRKSRHILVFIWTVSILSLKTYSNSNCSNLLSLQYRGKMKMHSSKNTIESSYLLMQKIFLSNNIEKLSCSLKLLAEQLAIICRIYPRNHLQFRLMPYSTYKCNYYVCTNQDITTKWIPFSFSMSCRFKLCKTHYWWYYTANSYTKL